MTPGEVNAQGRLACVPGLLPSLTLLQGYTAYLTNKTINGMLGMYFWVDRVDPGVDCHRSSAAERQHSYS